MKNTFLIDILSSDLESEELVKYVYLQKQYCMDVFSIPYRKIDTIKMLGKNRLEVVLFDMKISEQEEEWYINLQQMAA